MAEKIDPRFDDIKELTQLSELLAGAFDKLASCAQVLRHWPGTGPVPEWWLVIVQGALGQVSGVKDSVVRVRNTTMGELGPIEGASARTQEDL